jgi:metallo-beta-lactamase class B
MMNKKIIITLSILTLVLSTTLIGCKKEKIVYQSDTLIINQLSRYVYQHISFFDAREWGKVACNGMIVIYQNEAIVFDTPPDDETSRELIEWIVNSLNSKIIAVISTHSHIDNLGGLNEFHRQGIASYAHNRTIQIAEENALPLPQNGFDKYLELNAGNEKVILGFFGEGHTCDNIIGYFPLENIMFGGCLIKAMGDGQGNLAEANVEEWAETVRRVKVAFPNVKKVIPGHGELGGIELLDYTINLFD